MTILQSKIVKQKIKFFVPDSELYEKTIQVNRILTKMDKNSLLLLLKIINNITLFPNDNKYRKIAHRRLLGKCIEVELISDLLLLIGFVSCIADFELKYIFEAKDTASFELLYHVSMLIEKQVSACIKKNETEKESMEQFKKREEEKKKLLDDIKLEMIARKNGTF
jgi:hypothetical protein